MATHIDFLLLGLGNGAVFAALAIALVVSYRSSGVLNFATGAIALYAAYTYSFLRHGQLLNPIPGFPQTIALGGPMGFLPALMVTLAIQVLLGVLLYLAVFRFLRNALPVAKAVASLGIMIALTGLLALRAGSSLVVVSAIFPSQSITVGGVRLPVDRLWLVVTIVGVALLLGALYRYTRFGLSTRAAAETEVGALVSGVAPERVAVINWAISAVVAGLAGILIAPLTPLVPGTYTLFIVPALAAALLGQFSKMRPAIIGGIVIGMLQSEAVFLQGRYSWFPQSGVAELIPLILVLVVLVVRGRPLPSRGALIQQTIGRAPRPRHVAIPALLGTGVLVVALLALHGSDRSALIFSLIMGIICLSWVVVTGYTGQVSLAQLTLAGTAGFLLSPLTTQWGIPFPIAPLVAALGAAVIGVVVGLPALRIRGLFVAIVTLAFAVAVEALWFENDSLNGGNGGAKIASPTLFGIKLGVGSGLDYPRLAFGLMCIVVLVLVGVCVAKLRTSGLGAAMLAVRADERSAAAMGISVVRTKLVGFAAGAFIAGIGGSLLAYQQRSVSFESFDALVGLGLFTIVYLVGITSVSGGILAGLLVAGGIAFETLNRLVSIGDWYGLVTGLALVLAVIRSPEGIVGPVHIALEKRRTRRVVSTAQLAAVQSDEPEPPATREGLNADSLIVSDLRVHYRGILAVEDVTLRVPAGAIVGLIGPNGAGKTTLMDALCGFVKYDGSVSLDGQVLDSLPPHQRARMGLGRTFQGLGLYSDLSVRENVVVGQNPTAHFGSRTRKVEDSKALEAVLLRLGLQTVRDRSVRELSQGQRQLVSIARALAGNPRLLLLDEPAAGLDTAEIHRVMDRLRAVRAHGMTVLLIDHDMSLVLTLCDLIYVLDFGQLIASGPPDLIRTNRRVADAYLGGTYSTPVPS